MKKILLFITTIIVFQSCNFKKSNLQPNIRSDKIKIINMPETYQYESNLSLILEKIEYIPLATSKECHLVMPLKTAFHNNHFFILDFLRGLYVFDQKGTYSHQNGKIGRGPGEFIEIRDFDFDEKGNVLILDYNRILRYRPDGNYLDKYLEFDFVTIQILHPGIRPLVPGIDLPQGVPPPADIDYIQKDYIFYMMTSIKKPNEAYTYGEYLEDQIPKVIKMYKEGGFETNQACMRIGDANSLTLSDPPCLTKIDTRIRYGKLHFHVDFRSWDLWAGFPTNLAAIQLLKEYMASEIGVKDGEIIATSKGLHLYEHSWELAKVVLRR